jgi:putative spermidine/putrescine transport system substrate-binding protein
MNKRFIGWIAGLLIGPLAGTVGAYAQSSPGVVMAAYGGGNGDTWREMVGKPFSAATSIPVQITDLPNTETPIRSANGNPQYNVAWVGYFQAANLYRDGMIESFDASDFPELKNVPNKYILKAPDGKIIGIPVQFQYYGIAYNTDQAKASDFSSWMSLTDPKWKGKLAEGQAFVVANYDLPMFAHMAGGSDADLDPGIPAFEKFNQNALTIMTSFAQGNTLLSRGEVAAAPFYSARVRALKKAGAAVDITVPKEGAVLLPYMLVVPKGAKNVDALMKFLRYATEPEPQVKMFDYSGYIPLNDRVKFDDKQTAELGMPLPDLLNKLYETDFWALGANMKKNTDIAEKIQAVR